MKARESGNGVLREQPNRRPAGRKSHSLEVEAKIPAILRDGGNVLAVGIGVIGKIAVWISGQVEHIKLRGGIENTLEFFGEFGTLGTAIARGELAQIEVLRCLRIIPIAAGFKKAGHGGTGIEAAQRVGWRSGSSRGVQHKRTENN